MEKATFTFPPRYEETLANGLSVVLVEDHELEGVVFACQMPFGEFSDPAGYEGTTDLLVGLMLKGTESILPDDFAEKMERYGASMFTEIGDEHTIIGCKLLSRFIPEVFPLYSEMMLAPGFRKRELDRLKREMVTGLTAETSEPMSLANRHFTSLLCTSQHPAGRIHTIKSVKHITLDRISDFYKIHISPNQAVLLIAGDFSKDTVLGLIHSHFDKWTAHSSAAPGVIADALAPLTANRIRIVDKPDISQVSFIIGHPIGGELAANRNQVALANYVLGGGNFSSRLMAAIRSAEGKTYGISSQVSCERNFGVFSISTSTQYSQARDMLSGIMKTYREFHTGGITEDELAKAKQFARGNMAFQLEGVMNVADKLLWLRQYNRDVSYIENFDSMVADISIESVRNAIASQLSSPYFAIAAVGKKEELSAILSEYGTIAIVPFKSDPA
jgi:zinc protease